MPQPDLYCKPGFHSDAVETVGWLRGFEPPTTGITIRYSNQLSYSHH